MCRPTMFRALIVLLFCLFALPTFADKCKDPIVDEVSALSATDVASIRDAQNKLVQLGADPRVQVLSSYHNAQSLDEYKANFQSACKSWQAPDGGLKNNIVLILVVPKKQATGFYFGSQWARQLNAGKATVSSDMNARFRDGNIAAGVIAGFKDAVDLMSVTPSNASKPVVITHPTDYTGLWSFFKWSLVVIVVFGVGYAAVLVLRRREGSRSAQRDAQSARSQCVALQNDYETPMAILKAKIAKASVSDEWRSRLDDLYERASLTYRRASSTFDSLNRSSNDPETPNLSVDEYRAMQQRYEQVVALFEQASEARAETESSLGRALKGEPLVRIASVAPAVTSRPAAPTTAEVRTTPAPETTRQTPKTVHHHHHHGRDDYYREPPTVVQHDTTIVVIDEERDRGYGRYDEPRWERQREIEPTRPVIVTPVEESAREGGISTNWGRSGDGDGISTNWGKSGNGDGVSTNWNNDDDDRTNRPSESAWGGGSGTTY